METIPKEVTEAFEKCQKAMEKAKTLEELEGARRDWYNAWYYPIRTGKAHQMPLRQESLNIVLQEAIQNQWDVIQRIEDTRKPALIDAWCEDFGKRVSQERILRETATDKVLEALPGLWAALKELYDFQSSLKADGQLAEIFSYRGYNVARYDGYSLPFGKPNQHAVTEREIISVYLLAIIKASLERGQLTADGVDTEAVKKHQPTMYHEVANKQVVGHG